MATQKSPQAESWAFNYQSDAGNVVWRVGKVAASSLTIAQDDVLQMVKVPLGAIVVDGWIRVSAGLGGSVTAAIGDGADTDRYLAASDINGTTFYRFNVGLGDYDYTADDTVDITLAGANPADDKDIWLGVAYILP